MENYCSSEEISPTLQFHGFTCIADLVDADFQVLVPIDASGDSISQELWERHLCQMRLVPMFGAESDLAGKWHIWISADGIAFAPSEYQASICLEGINAWLRTQSLPVAIGPPIIGPPFCLMALPWFITLPVMLMKEHLRPSHGMTAGRLCGRQDLALTFRFGHAVERTTLLFFALFREACSPEYALQTSG